MFDGAGEFNWLVVCDVGHEPSTSQKGNDVDGTAEKMSDHQQKTPTPCNNIHIYGKVSFNCQVLAGSKPSWHLQVDFKLMAI